MPIWINKLRYKGLSTLAAHGESLVDSEGNNMKGRAARGERLLTNSEAWKSLDESEKSQ